jgi:hypothetical protein
MRPASFLHRTAVNRAVVQGPGVAAGSDARSVLDLRYRGFRGSRRKTNRDRAPRWAERSGLIHCKVYVVDSVKRLGDFFRRIHCREALWFDERNRLLPISLSFPSLSPASYFTISKPSFFSRGYLLVHNRLLFACFVLRGSVERAVPRKKPGAPQNRMATRIFV